MGHLKVLAFYISVLMKEMNLSCQNIKKKLHSTSKRPSECAKVKTYKRRPKNKRFYKRDPPKEEIMIKKQL